MTERIQGRGASFNPGNRFEKLRIDYADVEIGTLESNRIETVFLRDSSRTILAKNDSPDVPFTYSINPYRGCEHGCVYCYARPTHEYLGFSSGLDFESKILVKEDAAALLEATFQHPSYEPEEIAFSGNTDCYQPIDRKLRLTRACLEVFLKYRNPVRMITKNALVLRDLDILKELAKLNLVSVTLSITSTDPKLHSRMEPRTSTPERRFETLRALGDAGVPCGVNIAPLIPGLNDSEIPEIIRRTAENGGSYAGYILLRLPYGVKDLFVDWVQREYPEKAGKILNRIRETRGGNLSDPRFHSRMVGEGEWANTFAALFDQAVKRYGLNEEEIDLTTKLFQRPGQMNLF